MTDSILTKSMLVQIERNDIVVRIAKVIDPGAFADWWDGTGPAAKKHEPSVRARYYQSVAMAEAQEILKTLAKMPDWKEQAASAEADAWRDMGVPVDEPVLRKIVDGKYF